MIPMNALKSLASAVGILSIGHLIGGCDSPEAKAGKSAGEAVPEDFDSAPGTVTGEKFKLNQLVSLGDSEWTVVAVKNLGSTLKGEEDEGIDDKTSEGKFIYVRFKMTNKTKGNEEILFTPTVQDSKGRNFEQLDSVDAMDYLPAKETTMDLEQLPAGVPKSFSAIFEVPSDATGLMFLARSISDVVDPELKAIELGF